MLLEEMFPALLAATHEFHQKTGGPWEVIVVDDGSVDDTIPWIEKNPEKNIKVITHSRNSGFAFACNLGFSACRYQIVILLNNDVLVDKNFILPMISHFEDKTVFGVTFKALGRDQSTFCNGGKSANSVWGFGKPSAIMMCLMVNPSPAEDPGPFYSFAVCGGFCAFDRQKLQEAGGFESLMSPFYWEDVELSYRAWKRGWVIHYEPKSVVYHDASTTILGAFNRFRIDRINTRNRFIFMWKNVHDPGMLIKHLGAIILLVLQSLFTFRAAFLAGLWDSLCLLPTIISKRKAERQCCQSQGYRHSKVVLGNEEEDLLFC